MKASRLAWRVLAFVPPLALFAPHQGAAQMSSPQVLTVGGGATKYNLFGDRGDSWVLTVRFDGAIGPYVIVEPGFAFMRFTGQFGARNFLMPEISFQGQGYLGPVRPFLGGGIGFANITTGPSSSEVTLHAVAGLRIRLANSWGLRVEARLRSVDPWHGHTHDLTAGFMRVLPSRL